MLDLLTTDGFAAWFQSLDAEPAEDVAATLEVIVQLGAQREAPGSSEWLLWYEHPILSKRPLRDMSKHIAPELLRFADEWGSFNGYVRRIIKHLESHAFTARLARLSPEAAATVSRAIGRIRQISKTRLLAVSEFHRTRRFFVGGQKPGERDLTALAGFVDVSEVRGAYFAALAAAGFEVADVAPTSTALREITLRSTPPGLRLLYGIDQSSNRGLVVLGEWLDRSFYGDSVRLAEALWGQFIEGEPLATRGLEPR